MARLLSLLSVCLLLALAGTPAALAEDEGAKIDEVIERLKALEKQLDELEISMVQRLTVLEKKIAQGAKPAPHPKENEARADFNEIRKLVNDGQLEDAKTRMANFLKNYNDTETAKGARRLHMEVLSVIGKEAPTEWGIEKWFQGEDEIDLASDKTTLLVFWETWCPHCKREVPKLQQFYTALKDEGLQVLGVTRITKSSTEETVQTFIDNNDITFPIVKEDGKLNAHFSVRGIPAGAVLKNGKVIWRGHPGELDEAKLKGWL
jgi:thiol-disulfide isomerase/thioredoxin